MENGKVVNASDPTTTTPAQDQSSNNPSTWGTLSASSTPTSKATPTPAPSSSNTGAIVRGVVGGVGGIVVAALAFWYLAIRRNLKKQQNHAQSYEGYQAGKQEIWQEPREVDAIEVMGELDSSTHATQELDVGQHRRS